MKTKRVPASDAKWSWEPIKAKIKYGPDGTKRLKYRRNGTVVEVEFQNLHLSPGQWVESNLRAADLDGGKLLDYWLKRVVAQRRKCGHQQKPAA